MDVHESQQYFDATIELYNLFERLTLTRIDFVSIVNKENFMFATVVLLHSMYILTYPPTSTFLYATLDHRQLKE